MIGTIPIFGRKDVGLYTSLQNFLAFRSITEGGDLSYLRHGSLPCLQLLGIKIRVPFLTVCFVGYIERPHGAYFAKQLSENKI